MEDIKETLARNSRLARNARGISQEELADLAGIDRTYISGIARAVRNPTITVVAKIAGALGIPVSALLSSHFSTNDRRRGSTSLAS